MATPNPFDDASPVGANPFDAVPEANPFETVEGPGVAKRVLNAANKGLGETLDVPGAAANFVFKPINNLIDKGIEMLGGTPDTVKPSISTAMEQNGALNEGAPWAPQSKTEEYVQSAARALGQNAPFMFNPAAIPMELAGSVGQGVGGQAARDAAPGSTLADVAGQLAGGIGGAGLSAALTKIFASGASKEAVRDAAKIAGKTLNEDELDAAIKFRDDPNTPGTGAKGASIQVDETSAPAPTPVNDFDPAQAPQINPQQASALVEEGLPRPEIAASGLPPSPQQGIKGAIVPDEALPAGPYDGDKYAANINTDVLGLSPETSQYLKESVQGIDHGTQTFDEVETAARELLGKRPILDILSHDPKVSEATTYQAAARTIEKTALDNMKAASDKILDPQFDTTQATDDFEKWRYVTALAAAKDSGNAALAGRLLNARKIAPGDDAAAMAKAFRQMGDEFGKLDAKAFAQKVQEYRDNPAALRRFVQDSYKPHFEDYALSAWYNGLLSGPMTHVRNIFGNISNAAWDLGEHGLASAIGKLRGGDDRVAGGEVTARLGGVVDALRDSSLWGKVGEAYSRGQNLSLKGENPNASLSDLLPKGPLKTAGKALEYGTRGLAAEDEFFRNLFTSSAYRGEAYRKAFSEGKRGEELSARVQQLLDNPTKKMDQIAEDYTKRIQFVDDPSPIGKLVQQLKSNKTNSDAVNRISKVVTNVVIPFARVADSTMRTVIRRSPLGFLDRYNRADFLAGGARRDLALARVALGSSALGAVAYAADKGLFTGDGPADYRKKAELQAGGWMPNAIKIGDTYQSLSGLAPASNQINVVASLVEKMKTGEISEASGVDQMLKMTKSFVSLMNNNNFTGDLGNVFSLLQDSGKGDGALKNYVAGLAASATTPAVVRQAEQAFGDGKVTNTTGDGSISDSIVNRATDAYRSDLPVKHDAYGEEVTKGGPLVRSTSTARGPVVAELQRLAKGDKTLVTPAPKTITTSGLKIKLEAKDYEEYQRVSGQFIQQGVAGMLADPNFAQADDEAKRKEVKQIVKEAREAARTQLFGGQDSPE